MRVTQPRRRSTITVVAVALATLLAGCTHSVAHPTQPTAATSEPSGSPSNANAEAARANALAATKALHSYAFDSTEILGGDTTTVNGRTVLPTSVDYTISKGTNQHEEVLRVSGTTYLRTLPGPWQKMTHPLPATDPMAGLLAALTAARGLTLDPASSQLTGTLTAHDATTAGLLTTATVTTPTIPVTFTLNPAGRITQFTLTTTLTEGNHPIALSETTTYTAFNTAPPILSP